MRIVGEGPPGVFRPLYRIRWRTVVRRARVAPLVAVVAERHDACLDAAGQLARVHLEEAVRVAGGGPHALVLEQGLVEQDRQVVACLLYTSPSPRDRS